MLFFSFYLPKTPIQKWKKLHGKNSKMKIRKSLFSPHYATHTPDGQAVRWFISLEISSSWWFFEQPQSTHLKNPKDQGETYKILETNTPFWMPHNTKLLNKTPTNKKNVVDSTIFPSVRQFLKKILPARFLAASPLRTSMRFEWSYPCLVSLLWPWRKDVGLFFYGDS